MDEMVAKGTAAKQDEEVKFSKFSSWCTNQEKIKNKEITKGNELIEKLKAEILKAEADIKSLTARIEELDADVARWKGDQESAKAVRDKENVDFKATNLDYTESIDAVDRAIGVPKKQTADVKQAALVQSLLQVRSLRTLPAGAGS